MNKKSLIALAATAAAVIIIALAAALLWGGKATISYDQVFALAAVIVLCSALLRFAALSLTEKEGGHDPV